CIEQGIQSGELHVQNSQQTSELLYNLWIGASLLNKIRQDDVSLQQALLATEQLLKGNKLN
ncbi:TetR/AcrR family transcriptional regulator, partial [Vibrio cholerae]